MLTSVKNGWMRSTLSSLALTLALVACGDDSEDNEKGTDSGAKPDASTTNDGGAMDAARPDASGPTDSAVPTDAKVDSGRANDAGSMAIPTLNGCTEAMYMDLSAPSAGRTVMFGGGLGQTYAPKCVTIAAGQMVTFSGSFTGHPIAKGTPQDTNAGSASNPITDQNTGNSKTVMFPSVGTYPYHCVLHGNNGMVGSIHVK